MRKKERTKPGLDLWAGSDSTLSMAAVCLSGLLPVGLDGPLLRLPPHYYVSAITCTFVRCKWYSGSVETFCFQKTECAHRVLEPEGSSLGPFMRRNPSRQVQGTLKTGSRSSSRLELITLNCVSPFPTFVQYEQGTHALA